MCGIAGIITFNGSSVSVERLHGMLERLRHRGPDEHGFLWADSAGRTMVKLDRGNREPPGGFLPTAALAHARLAILDISRGKQPLPNEDLSVWVTYNGEIYNHHELRERLSGLGHCFKTSHSDTEVIVHAYEEWGEDCLLLFRGMFAFALLDLQKKRLLIARDRFGVKPLYYLNDGGLFAFASELDALRAVLTASPEVDLQAIYEYLLYQYIPAPATVYRKMFKLPPGHFCRVSLESGSMDTLPYWESMGSGLTFCYLLIFFPHGT